MSQPRPEHDTPATTGKPPGLVVKIADAREREIALQRRAEIYTQELGYHGLDEYDKDAIHLVAMDERGEMVGAVRLLGPRPLPLELESHVPLDAEFNRALQVGGFWVHRKGRRIGSSWAVPELLRQGMVKVARCLGSNAIVLRTHIRPLSRYYRMAGFVHWREKDFVHPAWGPVFTMVLRVESDNFSSASRLPEPFERRPSLLSERVPADA
jgi:predicted GNAT family N-acyltransferase